MRRKKSNSKTWGFKKTFILKTVFLIASTLFFIVICKLSYNYFRPININAMPLIQKNRNPIRIIPKEATGLIMSYQNKTIYNNLQSTPQKEKSTSQSTKSSYSQDDELILIRDTQLNNNPLNEFLNSNQNTLFLSFGYTGTKISAEKKIERLTKQMPQLAIYKIKAHKVSDGRYKIKMTLPIPYNEANQVIAKAKTLKEECHVE